MTQNGLEYSAEQDRDRHLRTIAGRDLYFDWEDFLWDPQEWDEAIALALAREMGLETLDDTQWQVLRFMRKFYFYRGRAPMNKELKTGTGMTLMTLEKLFPRGIRMGSPAAGGAAQSQSMPVGYSVLTLTCYNTFANF